MFVVQFYFIIRLLIIYKSHPQTFHRPWQWFRLLTVTSTTRWQLVTSLCYPVVYQAPTLQLKCAGPVECSSRSAQRPSTTPWTGRTPRGLISTLLLTPSTTVSRMCVKLGTSTMSRPLPHGVCPCRLSVSMGISGWCKEWVWVNQSEKGWGGGGGWRHFFFSLILILIWLSV